MVFYFSKKSATVVLCGTSVNLNLQGFANYCKHTNEVKIAVLLKMGFCEILQRAYSNFCFNTVLLSII